MVQCQKSRNKVEAISQTRMIAYNKHKHPSLHPFYPQYSCQTLYVGMVLTCPLLLTYKSIRTLEYSCFTVFILLSLLFQCLYTQQYAKSICHIDNMYHFIAICHLNNLQLYIILVNQKNQNPVILYKINNIQSVHLWCIHSE